MLGKISSATFRDWVRPGQIIDVFAEVLSSRPKFATAKCHITVEQQPRAAAELLFGFVPRKHFAPDYRDRVLEEFLNRIA